MLKGQRPSPIHEQPGGDHFQRSPRHHDPPERERPLQVSERLQDGTTVEHRGNPEDGDVENDEPHVDGGCYSACSPKPWFITRLLVGPPRLDKSGFRPASLPMGFPTGAL